MERLGVATAADLELETMPAGLIEEAAALGSVLVARSGMGAWMHR